jgi:hypothetical protein
MAKARAAIIANDELEALKMRGRAYLGLTHGQLAVLEASGELSEVAHGNAE